MVEVVSSLEEGTWRRRAVVETDSYVIIPAATAFHELVPAAMMRLGYPHELAASAKGKLRENEGVEGISRSYYILDYLSPCVSSNRGKIRIKSRQ